MIKVFPLPSGSSTYLISSDRINITEAQWVLIQPQSCAIITSTSFQNAFGVPKQASCIPTAYSGCPWNKDMSSNMDGFPMSSQSTRLTEFSRLLVSRDLLSNCLSPALKLCSSLQAGLLRLLCRVHPPARYCWAEVMSAFTSCIQTQALGARVVVAAIS